ncbi:MAG: KH domain-containing protein [Thermoanaerobaculia bacterium]|nr:KH domain-containing protein [Thermoanaerobaculia bacterium]
MSVRDQLEEVVRLMVDEPEQVELEELSDREGTTFRLTVADGDLGKVIGRQGRTARALRTVLSTREVHGEGPYSLEIVD